MKRIAYSFLFVALLSCGNSSPSPNNRIVLQFRDSTIHDYFLLSVRNNSLVVSHYKKENISDEFLIGSAEIIPFEKIEAVYYTAHASTGDIFLPGIGRCIAGSLGSGIIAGPSYKGDNVTPNFEAIALGGIAGFTLGAIAGDLLNNYDRQFFLDTKEHVMELRHHAFYDHEPTELQEIK